MTDKALVENFKTAGVDAIETAYTSPSAGKGAIITAFTASNNHPTSVSYKAYIYDGGGSLVSAIIPQTIVVKDRFHSGPSIVNQVIPAGGTLRIENSAANSLNYYVTGREQA